MRQYIKQDSFYESATALMKVKWVRDAVTINGPIYRVMDHPERCSIFVEFANGYKTNIPYSSIHAAEMITKKEPVPVFTNRVTCSEYPWDPIDVQTTNVDAKNTSKPSKPRHDIFMCSKLLFKN